MGRKKVIITLPHLVDAGGNIEKEWFVEYSCRNPQTNNLKRFREWLFCNALLLIILSKSKVLLYSNKALFAAHV